MRELLIEPKKQLLKLKGNVTEFNSWVRQQVNKLHVQDQEALDLTYYLLKAYKAARDEDFITYIKDKKRQGDDGRASYNTEELMTMAENKYEARLLDEDNAWGTPSDEQEETLAMTAEIKVLKQGNNKASNSIKKGNKKSQKESKDKPNKDSKKKKTNNKWDWKNTAPKDMNAKEDGVPVTEFQKKKYFWCPHQNNGAGMWTLRHPMDCKANNKDDESSLRANVAPFDTVDSDCDLQCSQSQVISCFWL